jgi:hypothetical protein
MADPGGKRASMKTIVDAISSVRDTVKGYPDGECDRKVQQNALQFLDGLEVMVSSFCRRLTGDNETLDPCPKR